MVDKNKIFKFIGIAILVCAVIVFCVYSLQKSDFSEKTASIPDQTLDLPDQTSVPPVQNSDINIAEGPFITALTENAVIISWQTDVDTIGKIEYGIDGNYSNVVTECEDGLAAVNKHHIVIINGLRPGTTYNYRTVCTEVKSLEKDNIMLGNTAIGADYSFTTHSTADDDYSFCFITDTHEYTKRITRPLSLVPQDYSFVVHGGDAFAQIQTTREINYALIEPCVETFAKFKPLYFVRGNHEYRGTYPDKLLEYLPTLTGEWYYSFRKGDSAYTVIDTGISVDDSDQRYGGLIQSTEYRHNQFNRAKEQFKSDEWTTAPMRIVFAHIPFMTNKENTDPVGGTQAWTDLMNDAGVKLVISGHRHIYRLDLPDEEKNYHHLIVGQNQIARVEIKDKAATVTTYEFDGEIVETFTVY